MDTEYNIQVHEWIDAPEWLHKAYAKRLRRREDKRASYHSTDFTGGAFPFTLIYTTAHKVYVCVPGDAEVAKQAIGHVLSIKDETIQGLSE